MTEQADSPSSSPRVWRETFLARYPRKWKLTGIGLFLLLAALPFLDGHVPSLPKSTQEEGVSAHFGPKHQDGEAKEGGEASAAAAASPAADDQADASQKAQPGASSAAAETETHDDPAATGAAALQEPLTPAPDPTLVETVAGGALPIIGADGRQPWQVYARPFDLADKRPRIAIVMDGLGLSRVATDAAIHQLPGPVTLAFDPHATSLPAWLARARQDGHETLLILPAEPSDYPRSDPGPHTLLTYLPVDANKDRLLWAMAQGAGYVGMMVEDGQRLASEPEHLAKMLHEIKSRGVLVFDATLSRRTDWRDMTKSLHVPFVGASIRLDAVPSPEGIDSALTYLEQTARVSGFAVGIASPLPLTLDRLTAWSRQLATRGIVLTPVSAVVQ